MRNFLRIGVTAGLVLVNLFYFGVPVYASFADKKATRQIQITLNDELCKKSNTIYLTPDSPRAKFSGVITAPGNGYQNYKITCIDVTNFTQGGKLIIKISLKDGASGGSFDLFPFDTLIPTEGRPNDSLVGSYDISPNSSTEMVHYFGSGSIFQFGATGNWFSRKGSTNFYKVNVYVDKP